MLLEASKIILAAPSCLSFLGKKFLLHLVYSKGLSSQQTYWTLWHVQAWDSPGKKTGVGTHFLLQGIFPTKG